MTGRKYFLALPFCLAAACTDATSAVANGAAPTVAAPNGVVSTSVGSVLTYDASKAGAAFAGGTPITTATGGRGGGGAVTTTGLQYQITFEGAANGLSANGSVVTGQPNSPAVTWATITATDAVGRTATDRFAIVAFAAGLATPSLPGIPFRYADASVTLPAHFRATINGTSVIAGDNTPPDNPISDAGASLGRVLFYDMRLSARDGLSCAGCHSPFISFTDTPQLSVGFAGGLTGRHTPALANVRFYRRGHFFWDERAATLEAQVVGPIQNSTEMGMTLDNLVAKLVATPYYPPLFQAAFGSPGTTSDRMARALAQYVRSLVSGNAKYDRAFAANGTANFAAVFTAQEQQGEQLFRTSGCATCHATVAQVIDSVHNTGLDAITTDTGAGRGAFKAPSLRNVAVRPRFMHDGRFTTLAQVIDFYDSGVQPNANLDPLLKVADGTPRRLRLNGADKTALVAFLNTLTDSTFLTDPRFANPFAPTTAGPPPPPPPLGIVVAAVTIQATAYHPPTITVAPRTVVRWTNLDNARHSAGFLTAGVGATPTFTSGTQQLTMPAAPGTYRYQCAVHGAAMSGTVIVQ
jgi:cytochrome c peroxidase